MFIRGKATVRRHLPVHEPVGGFELLPQVFSVLARNVQFDRREGRLFGDLKRERVSSDTADGLRIVPVADAGEEPCVGKLLCGGVEFRASGRLALAQAGCGDYGGRRQPLIPCDLDLHHRVLRQGGGHQHERHGNVQRAHHLILSQA
jgi:hypothetical protein